MDGVTVPPRLLSLFLALFHEVFLEQQSPPSPQRTLQRLLRRSRPVIGNYYAADRWVFDIAGGELADLFIAPSVTVHARERLEERFNIRLHGQDDMIRLAITVAGAEPLSQRQRRRYRIAGDVQARLAGNCIFLLRERLHLVTVLSIEEERPNSD